MTYRIGIDGGGTKTECILIDAAGKVRARRLAPGCNPSVVGPAQARLLLPDALRSLIEQARGPRPKIEATLLCMAGSPSFWSEFASELSGFGHVVAAPDSLPVLELATQGKPGLALHAGTGSFVAARAAAPRAKAGGETAHYAGGLGWRFGDAAGGYDIGRRAVARALLEGQGWLPPSGLGALVRKSAGKDEVGALARHFYHDPEANPKIAALAPGVLRLAARGDAAARELIAEATGELLALAQRVAARLFPKTPPGGVLAGLSGPILTQPFVVRSLAARAPFKFRTVREAPIEGVRLLLRRL